MRVDRKTKTLLATTLATSAIVLVLAAAPAASTSGAKSSAGLRPPSGHTVASANSRSLAPQPPVSLQGSPVQEAAVMLRAEATRRHEAWLDRLRARQTSPRSGGSASSPGLSRAVRSVGSVHDLIIALFTRIAGAGQVSTALCVANRESHFNAYARNPFSSAAGVFQWVSSSWRSYSGRYGFAGASVFDAYANISVAAHAVASGGWGPWGGGCW